MLENFSGQVELAQASTELVKEVQTLLKQFALYAGAIDGKAGAATLKAFQEFKDKEYLGKGTLLGATTAKALLEAGKAHRANTDAKSAAVVIPPRTEGFKLPGLSAPVKVTDPIYTGSKFTWNEATKSMSRLPINSTHAANIIKVARVMDEVRTLLGNKRISVTSWYRPPAVNRAVGGASNSMHIQGLAVDFNVQGMTPQQVYARLEPWWGQRGGLASASNFTHIDARGYKARWRYN